MKMKALFLLPGVLALSLAASTMQPLTQKVWANTMPTEIAQAQPQAAGITLTDDQKMKIQKLKESTSQQMDQVFTAEQKAQIQTARKNNQKPNISLTNEQKGKVKTILTSYQTQMEKILTPGQIQELKKMSAAKKAQ